MVLSPREAAEALQAIESTESRSTTLRHYRSAAPHLMLWGLLWAVGYGLTEVMPARANATARSGSPSCRSGPTSRAGSCASSI